MEGGIEAGHGGNVGQDLGHHVERRERLRLVERRQVGQRAQAPNDGRIDDDGA